jgi:uncharacterized coiled-coil protein SlyX
MSEEIISMLKAIREAQEITNAKLESMDKRIESLEERVEKGFAEVNERLERFEQRQVRSEAVIETLSYRSIEQETDIKALKRAR